MAGEKFSLVDLKLSVGKQNHIIIPKKVIINHSITPHDTLTLRIKRADRVDIASFHARVHASNNSVVIPKVLVEHFELNYGDKVTISIGKILKDTKVAE